MNRSPLALCRSLSVASILPAVLFFSLADQVEGAVVQITLGSKGLASLTVSGVGADSHNWINSAGSRGDFSPTVTLKRPDGTTYSVSHFQTGTYTRVMDPVAQRLTLEFTGLARLELQYSVSGGRLGLNLQVTALHPTDRVVDLKLNFMNMYFPGGQAPVGWVVSDPPSATNISDPAVLTGNFRTGKVCYLTADGTEAYIRFGSINNGGHELWARDYRLDLGQGGVFRHQLAVVFGDETSSPLSLAGDVYQAWREKNPVALIWEDRRPIGATFLASSAHRSITNPRGWFNMTTLPLVDAATGEITVAGMEDFRSRLLARADNEIAVLRNTGSQGLLIWDCEGSRHGHPITYIGDPRLLSQIAPEMEYRPTPDALPTIDAYIRKLRDAGFRVGMTIRPQIPQLGGPTPAGTLVSDQIKVPTNSEALDVLDAKISYAIQRWGLSLFYIDTDVLGTGGMATSATGKVGADVYAELMNRHPDILIMPELNTSTVIASVGAKYKELDLALPRTADGIRDAYPDAFSLINVMDGDFEGMRDHILLGVKRGDILMHRGWFSDPKNPLVRNVYQQALTENQPPVAVLAVTPVPGQPRTYRFDASGTLDDGSIAVYRWNTGDGEPGFETGADALDHTFPAEGLYTVTLQVQDTFGALSAENSVVVRVGSAEPDPTVVDAASGSVNLGNDAEAYGVSRGPGSLQFADGGAGVRLTGDIWAAFPLAYSVTPNTVLEVDVEVLDGGEISGIGLDENLDPADAPRIFQVAGSQLLAPGIDIRSEIGSGLQRIVIPIGQFYVGSMMRLVLLAGDSADRSANARFSNIRLFEQEAASYSDEVLADAPVAFFELEEPAGSVTFTDTAYGISASRTHFDLQAGHAGLGGTLAVRASSFGSLSVPDADNRIRRQTGTWEMWVMFSAAGAIVDLMDVGGGAFSTGLVIRGGGGQPFVLKAPSSATSSVVAQPGRWYHLVLTHDGSRAKLYVDGNLEATVLQSRSISTNAPVLLAQRSRSSTVYHFYDNLAVYPVVLSEDRIQAHFAAGSAQQ